MTLVLARTDKRGNAVVATDTRVTQKDHERNKLGFFDADLLDPPRPKVWLEPRGWCVTAGLDTREARRALQEAGSGDASVLAQVVRETVPEHLFPKSAIIVVPRVGELMAVMDAGSRMGGGLFWAGQPNGLSESQKDDWDGWLQSAPPLTSNIPGFIHWCALFHLSLYNMLGEDGSISPRAEFGVFQRGEAGYIPPTPVERIVQLSDREIQDMIQAPPARVEDEAPERPVVHHTSIDGGELIRVRDPVNSRFVSGEDVFDKSNNDLDDVPDGSQFARILTSTTDGSKVTTIRRPTSGVDVSAEDVFDTTREDTTDITEGTGRGFIHPDYTDVSRRPTIIRRDSAGTDLDADDVAELAAGLASVELTQVFDDGTDDDYSASWNPNSKVTDVDHDLVIEFFREGVSVGEKTITSPATTTSTTFTDTGGGDGSGNDHSATFRLKNTSGEVLDSKTSNQMSVT